MPYSKIDYPKWISFTATIFLYTLFIFISNVGLADRATASLILICGVYLVFRPEVILHPANLVFANYLIYLVMPYSLFLTYRTFGIEYILPWGLINDWSKLSNDALFHFEITFLLFYLSAIYLHRKVIGGHQSNSNSVACTSLEVSKTGVWLLSMVILIGCAFFFSLTGGVDAWLTNYSETYIKNKAGLGLLNFTLIIFAHLLAFIAGWMKWRDNQKFSTWLWSGVLIALLACIFLQGIKSRIPLILFFFLLPKLVSSELKLGRESLIFLLLIVLFSVGMYFRSDGFYGTPRLAIEYLQSYFNTIFLHDLVLSNPPPTELTGSMFRGINKYQEIFGEPIPRENYDLSVALTQIYFPADWYNDGATQQWPIETDFYLTTAQPIFWAIPIFLYMFLIVKIGGAAVQGMPFFLFLYGAELVRIMSIFRSGLFTWDLLILVFYYCAIFIVCNLFVFRRQLAVETTTHQKNNKRSVNEQD